MPLLVAGRIGRAHGIQGWVRVNSYTEPLENLLSYSPWFLSANERPLQTAQLADFLPGTRQDLRATAEVEEGRHHGRGLIVRLKDCDNRNQAERLRGLCIQIEEEQLPILDAEDFYWKDLIGLKVFNQQGRLLGEVQRLMETGANDVLVVCSTEDSEDQRQRMIPWLPGQVVARVDLETSALTVDWELDY